MKKYQGLAASQGIAMGSVYLFKPAKIIIENRQISTDEIENEISAFTQARAKVNQHLSNLYQQVLERQGEHDAEIFASHQELLNDEELENDIKSLISDEGLSASAAVKQYLDEVAATMGSLDDEYLRERAAEFLDLQHNLLLALHNLPFASLSNVPAESIVFAEDLTPSETAQLNPEKVKAFVLQHGGLTSHVAILARNLGLPAVMGLESALTDFQDGDFVIIDGDNGQIIANADEQKIKEYKEKQQENERLKHEYSLLKNQEALTLDGKKFKLFSNIGSNKDLHLVEENGSEGIGLFRSEFLFMEASKEPSEEQQYKIYREVVEKLQGKTVILRLLDVGGDKPLSYVPFPKEENPFLGWRGVRMYPEALSLFQTQIRAAIRAAAHGDLWIMIPMIINIAELQWVKNEIQVQKEALQTENKQNYSNLKVGVMIETPAAALIAPQLAKFADFFSIGTNDLTQYTLAVDRGNSKINSLYDGLHPAVLRLMAMTCEAAHQAKIEVGICGEMSSQLEALPLLVGMGFDEISISGKQLPAVKYHLRKLNFAKCQDLLAQSLQCNNADEVRELLKNSY